MIENVNEPIPKGLKGGLERHHFLSTNMEQVEFLENFSEAAVFGAIKNKLLLLEIYRYALSKKKQHAVVAPDELPICIKVGFQNDLSMESGFSLRHIIARKHLIESNIYKAFDKPNQTLVLVALVKELLSDINTVLNNENMVMAWVPQKNHLIFAAKSNTLSANQHDHPEEHIFCTLCFHDNFYQLVIGTLYSISQDRFQAIKNGEYLDYQILSSVPDNSNTKNSENKNSPTEGLSSYATVEKQLEPKDPDPQTPNNDNDAPSFQANEISIHKQIDSYLSKQERSVVAQNKMLIDTISKNDKIIKKIIARKEELETLEDKYFILPINDHYNDTYKLVGLSRDNLDSEVTITVRNASKKALSSQKRQEKNKELLQVYIDDKSKQCPEINRKLETLKKLQQTTKLLLDRLLGQKRTLNENMNSFSMLYLQKVCDFLSYAIKNKPSQQNEQYVKMFEYLYEVRNTRLKLICDKPEEKELYEKFLQRSDAFLDKYQVREALEKSIQNRS